MNSLGKPLAKVVTVLVMALLMAGVAVLGLCACGHPTTSKSHPGESSPFPARPLALSLDTARVNPCGLLTPEQVDQLGTGPGRSSTDETQPGNYECQWSRFPEPPDDAWLVRVVGLEAETLIGSAEQVVTIDGFGAIVTRTGIGPTDENCQIYVDAAPGHSIEVQYDNLSRDHPGINPRLACQLATKVADWVVANLRDSSTGSR